MASYLRSIVSGKKARTVDKELGIDLDLAVITDQIIIMGWPASGIAALYRNRRSDVRRWLEHKYGKGNFRIFNFCPRTENAYDASEFDGFVNRYPFPDHHPPPMSLIPIYVRDIKTWLDEDKKRVAVIHCKAGKGRSGTMTCCYLLSLPKLPRPPQWLKQKHDEGSAYTEPSEVASTTSAAASDTSASEGEQDDERTPRKRGSGAVAVDALDTIGLKHAKHGKKRAERLVAGLRGSAHLPAEDEEAIEEEAGPDDHANLDEGTSEAGPSKRQQLKAAMGLPSSDEQGTAANAEMVEMAEHLAAVFQLHSTQRMKPDSGAKGVSIPSQRRFVGYWARCLAGDNPRVREPSASRRQVAIESIVIHTSSERLNLPGPLGARPISVIVSTYRTDYIEALEKREQALVANDATEKWSDDDWLDKSDLITQVGRLVQSKTDDEGLTRRLLPADESEKSGLVVDADREVQFKLLVGKTGTKHSLLPDVASLGYCWLVPSFESTSGTHTFVARADGPDIDFSKPAGRVESVEISWRSL